MDTQVILAVAIGLIAFVLLSVIRSISRSRNIGEPHVGLGGMRHESDEEEEKAQKAKADALAAHDATFRNGLSEG